MKRAIDPENPIPFQGKWKTVPRDEFESQENANQDLYTHLADKIKTYLVCQQTYWAIAELVDGTFYGTAYDYDKSGTFQEVVDHLQENF